MDTSTGRIDTLENFKPNERKNLVLLNDEQKRNLFSMTRKERREYYRKNKKQFEGKTWSEVKNEIG